MAKNYPHKYIKRVYDITKTKGNIQLDSSRGGNTWYSISKNMGGQRTISIYLEIANDEYSPQNIKYDQYPDHGEWKGREVAERMISQAVGSSADWITSAREAQVKNSVKKTDDKSITEYETEIAQRWAAQLDNSSGSSMLQPVEWIDVLHVGSHKWEIIIKGRKDSEFTDEFLD